MTMHEYRCQHCGFHWFQEKYFAHELCISCGESALYLGAQERADPRENRIN